MEEGCRQVTEATKESSQAGLPWAAGPPGHCEQERRNCRATVQQASLSPVQGSRSVT